ncbi:MAG: AAA family ATPase [Alphaproteobacteria bacterium]|nr:AAA family ATPase [Alphaproteobacteria bacterium]
MKKFKPGEFVNPSTLEGFTPPPREWFVEGLIPHKTVTLLSGDGGLGKSLLALQLLTSAVTGKPWLGMKTMKCNSFGLFCEDSDEELWRRLHSITNAYGVSMLDCDPLYWLSGIGCDPVLMNFAGSDHGSLTDFFDKINNRLKEGHFPELIVIDTASDVFAGDENKRIHTRNFINRCLNKLAQDMEATVILTSHPSRAGMLDGSGISGSTAWNNSVRSRLYLTRPQDDKNKKSNRRILQVMKSNYGSTEHELEIEWRNGVFTPIQNTIGQNPHDREINDEAAYLFALAKLHQRGLRALVQKNQPNYGPSLMKTMQEAKGISKARLEEAQDRLMNKEVIANVEDSEGPKSRRKWQIQIINSDTANEIMNPKLF